MSYTVEQNLIVDGVNFDIANQRQTYNRNSSSFEVVVPAESIKFRLDLRHRGIKEKICLTNLSNSLLKAYLLENGSSYGFNNMFIICDDVDFIYIDNDSLDDVVIKVDICG